MSFSKISTWLRMVIQEEVARQLSESPIRKPFDIPLPEDLQQISSLFWENGKKFYLVGGSVRDALMGKEPKDLDVATDAKPDEIIAILRSNPAYTILEIGKSFGVIKVVTPEKNEYEIATFRKDIGVGRRPDSVEFTDIEQDSARRDLTINALFYDIQNKEIVDYVGGIEDISRGTVRTVGNPDERFGEDRLRVLRAIRFAGRFGTRLDRASDESIKANYSLSGVSSERIRDEFLKGIKSASSVGYFLDLVSTYDLWSQIFPGLSVRTDQRHETKTEAVQLALLLRDNDPRVLIKKLNALKYSAKEVSQISFLVLFQDLVPGNAYRLKKLFATSKVSPRELTEFASFAGKPKSELVKAFLAYEPSVSGEELQAAGFSGKDLGRELERIETERFQKLL